MKKVIIILFSIFISSIVYGRPAMEYFSILNNTSIDLVCAITLNTEDGPAFPEIDYFENNIFVSQLSYHILPMPELVLLQAGEAYSLFDVMRDDMVSNAAKFNLLIESIVCYDSDGYAVMVITDVTNEIFETRGDVENKYSSLGHCLYISQEDIDIGREKYKAYPQIDLEQFDAYLHHGDSLPPDANMPIP